MVSERPRMSIDEALTIAIQELLSINTRCRYTEEAAERLQSARALLAALKRKPEKKPCRCGDPECQRHDFPDPPKPAERTAEEILEKMRDDPRSGYFTVAAVNEALPRIRELRAERDHLQAERNAIQATNTRLEDDIWRYAGKYNRAAADRDVLAARIEKAKTWNRNDEFPRSSELARILDGK